MRKKLITSLLVTLFVVGCEGVPQKSIPVSAKPVEIKVDAIGSNPTCACPDDFPFYAVNRDTKYEQVFYPQLIETEKATGKTTYTTLPAENIAANETKFLGCSIGPEKAEALPQQCIFKRVYRIASYSTSRVTSLGQKALFGSRFQPSIATCQVACSNPNNPYCYDLGVKGKALVSPFDAIVDGAWSKQKGVVTHSEVLAKYNLKDADDTCNRGNTTIDNGVAVNESVDGQGCKITAKGGLSPLQTVTSVNLYIKPKMEAHRVDGIRIATDPAKDVELPDLDSSTLIEFEGVDADTLNEDFAGEVRFLSVTPNKTILATTRGCLSVPR